MFSTLYLNKYNLFHTCSVNILQDIQNFPNHNNKRLNPQRKFQSTDSTGHLNRRRLRVHIQKFYMALTLHLCVTYGSKKKWRLLPYTTLTDCSCITKVESVYYTVRTKSLYKIDIFHLQRVNMLTSMGKEI
jgi:hypothetical protein